MCNANRYRDFHVDTRCGLLSIGVSVCGVFLCNCLLLRRLGSIFTNGFASYMSQKFRSVLAMLACIAVFAGCTRNVDSGVVVEDTADKWGFIDHSGKFVLDPVYERVTSFSEQLAGVDQSARWGYIDTKGKFVIERQYEEVRPFSLGYAGVRAGGKWGVINTRGQLIIPFTDKYEAVGDAGFLENSDASKDYMIAIKKDGKWGFVGLQKEDAKKFLNVDTNKVLIDFHYLEAGKFADGLAPVKANVKGLGTYWGYIDRTNKMVIPARYVEATNMKDRLGEVRDQAGAMAIVDSIGTVVFKNPLESKFKFHEELALMQKSNGKWGYVNRSGKFQIKARYVYAEDFSEGLAVVQPATSAKKGFIDLRGKLVIPAVFIDARAFSDGLAAVKVSYEQIKSLKTRKDGMLPELVEQIDEMNKKDSGAATGTGTGTGTGTDTGAGTDKKPEGASGDASKPAGEKADGDKKTEGEPPKTDAAAPAAGTSTPDKDEKAEGKKEEPKADSKVPAAAAK